MDNDIIQRAYFNAERLNRLSEKDFKERYPNGMETNNLSSIAKLVKVARAEGAASVFLKMLTPKKDIIVMAEMAELDSLLDEIFDDYEKSETEEEEDRVLKRFYDLYEVRKDDIDEE